MSAALAAARPEGKVGLTPNKLKGDHKYARRFITALTLYFNGNKELYLSESKKLGLTFSLL